MTAIIDYGAGNVANVSRAFSYLGAETFLTSDPDSLRTARAAVLPGVGAFGHASDCLRKNGMSEALAEFIKSGRPFLGICLGMQLLFSGSQESAGASGLDIIEGSVVKFENNLKVPQIGYNSVTADEKARLFDGMPARPYFYFVHSFYCSVTDPEAVCAKTEYGVGFDSAFEKGNIFAVQFHPEKSGAVGLKLLENFIKISGNY